MSRYRDLSSGIQSSENGQTVRDQKTNGDTSDKAKLIAALEAVKFNSPRGAFEFDKDTHNVVQDMYIREAKTVNGQAVNTISDKIGRVTDPGK